MDDPTRPPAFSLRFDSTDEDEIEHHVATGFPGMRMTIEGRPADAPIRLQQHATGDERLAAQRLRLTPLVRAVGDLGDVRMVGILRAGALSVGSDDAPVDTSKPFLYPDGAFRSTADREDVELLVVDRTALDRTARLVTGDPEHRLRFIGSAPVSPAAERYWRSAHRHVADSLLDPLLRESPLIRDELMRFAVRALLLVFPSSATDDAVRVNAVVTPHRHVDSATAFIEANAHRPIDLDDIAAAADAAAQSLVRAFRQRHGRTPLQYLRDVRHLRVHQDLVAADPWSGATVADVVRRWSFTSSGRFAEEYRRRFGETPSATLRR